jgi:hypothetical protein
MARSLTQTKINSTYSTSPEPMSQQIYLTQFGLMAERHRREDRARCPKAAWRPAFDPQFNDRNFLIHDYFFAKGIEKVSEAVTRLPPGIYRNQEQADTSRPVTDEAILAPDYVKENAFALHEGVLLCARVRRSRRSKTRPMRRHGAFEA